MSFQIRVKIILLLVVLGNNINLVLTENDEERSKIRWKQTTTDNGQSFESFHSQISAINLKISRQGKVIAPQDRRIRSLKKELNVSHGTEKAGIYRRVIQNSTVSLSSNNIGYPGKEYWLTAVVHCRHVEFCRAPQVYFYMDDMLLASVLITFAGRECQIYYPDGTMENCPHDKCHCADFRNGDHLIALNVNISLDLQGSLFHCKFGNGAVSNTVRLHVAVGGAAYAHWGGTNCGNNKNERVLTGYSAWLYHNNNAIDMVCLPNDSQLYTQHNKTHLGLPNAFGRKRRFQTVNLPSELEQCAICRSLEATSVITIPGKMECYAGWHLEYSGYLGLAEYDTVCIDKGQTIKRINDARLVTELGIHCSVPPCTSKMRVQKLPCVVCTK